MPRLIPGDRAPDFTLPAAAGEKEHKVLNIFANAILLMNTGWRYWEYSNDFQRDVDLETTRMKEAKSEHSAVLRSRLRSLPANALR